MTQDLKTLMRPFHVAGAVKALPAPVVNQPEQPEPKKTVKVLCAVEAGTDLYERKWYMTGNPNIDRGIQIMATTYTSGSFSSVSIRTKNPKYESKMLDTILVSVYEPEDIDLLIEALQSAKAAAFPPGQQRQKADYWD